MGEAAIIRSGRQWSDYQEAIFAEVARGHAGEPHLVINALAGTGKSTTLEACVKLAAGYRVGVLAFNKDIAAEMTQRLSRSLGDGEGELPPWLTVKTLHSLGMAAIGKSRASWPKVSNFYVHDLARKELKISDYKRSKEATAAVAKLVGRAKGSLVTDRDAIDELADEMGLEIEDKLRLPVIKLATAFVRSAERATSGPINFDDMIFIPAIQSLPFPHFDWLFVDETQDLNPAQLRMVMLMAEAGARVVAVGDPNQAIYGFRGADRGAMSRMVAELDAKVLPLSICYRCGTSIIAEAQAQVPAIEAAPGAPAGKVATVTMQRCIAEATPGDFVVSRTNAPLIKLCHTWLKDGVRARIRGRDVSEGLTSWITRSGAGTIPDLASAVAAWELGELTRLEELGRSTEAVTDKAECLRALASCCNTIKGLLEHIEELFAPCSDEGEIYEYIELSSTHRAKGLEADVVWLLRDTYMQSRWVPAKRGDEESGDKVWVRGGRAFVRRFDPEEANLFYVAKTRAKSELYYVTQGPANELE